MSGGAVSAHNIVISTKEKSPLAIPQSKRNTVPELLAEISPSSK
jgi:hypothetical protein